ncbi:MAG TPA: hypothetical protein ENJ94_00890, partial [Gammaproteobacteria bacterium]|nr:hypothetical protein [Gammaproteobacteria bacterium]
MDIEKQTGLPTKAALSVHAFLVRRPNRIDRRQFRQQRSRLEPAGTQGSNNLPALAGSAERDFLSHIRFLFGRRRIRMYPHRTLSVIGGIPAPMVCLIGWLLAASAGATPLSLVFERDDDVAGVVEVFVQTYPTLGDLMGDTNGNGNFSALDINPDYSIGGAFFDGNYNLVFERDTDVAGVAEVFVQTYPTLGDLMGDTNGNGNFS